MANPLTYDQILSACRPGGASVLTSITRLRAAAGTHATVAPAKFVSGRDSTYAFERRWLDGGTREPRTGWAVIIDSPQSQRNRGEHAVLLAAQEGHRDLTRVPRMEVTYGDTTYSDWELPHRYSDGHFRAASVDGESVTAHPTYRAARDASPADASALFTLSPMSLIAGAWDSTRRSNQGRYRSALTGEIIGVVAGTDGDADVPAPALKGGARVDPVGMQVNLVGNGLSSLLADQADELSPKLLTEAGSIAAKAKDKQVQAKDGSSRLGLGGVPPSLNSLAGIACETIIRSTVLSFATLRQLRFGQDAEIDTRARAALAALGLSMAARSDSELYLRANCDLVEASPPVVVLDQRYGQSVELGPLDIATTDAVLREAVDALAGTPLEWSGQIFRTMGNPLITGGATEDAED